jgi:uncharacterized circularly permuted ATP-grasp superfamily protein
MDTNYPAPSPDPLDALPDAVAAQAFRHLVRHLRQRHDAQNIDLMGLAGSAAIASPTGSTRRAPGSTRPPRAK